jgi:hypothetical protein
LPEAFTQAKTYTVKPGPVTTEGWKFQRNNPDFFDAYPGTAQFLMPDVHLETLEFDYQRYLERLRTSEAEQWTGEQIAGLNDKMLGEMEMENVMQRIQYLKDAGDNETYELEKARLRAEIQDRHPYFGQPTPGKRTVVSTDQKREEVAAWLNDPNLRSVPIVEGAREYLAARDDVLATLTSEYNLTTLDRSQQRHAVQARVYLRGIADAIVARNPEFKYLFDRIYAREISEQNDGYSAELVDFYGDDLFEVTMGITPDTLPTFDNQYLGASA